MVNVIKAPKNLDAHSQYPGTAMPKQ